MSLKHAILGFLSLQPFSGYDLKKVFDGSVRHFWPADQSQIYRTLKQLHEGGLVRMEVIPREEQLDVKVYDITDDGRRELHAWLSTPLPLAEAREPFLVQLYFAFLLDDAQVLRLLEAELAGVEELLRTYDGVYETAVAQERGPEMGRPFFYSMLTLEFGTQANRWYRDWLLSVKQRVESGVWQRPLQTWQKEN